LLSRVQHEIATKNASGTFSNNNNNKQANNNHNNNKKPRKLKFWKKGRIAKNQKVTAGWLFFVSVTKYELSERFQPSRTRLF